MPTYIVITDPEVAPEAPITTSLMTRLRDNALAYWGAPTGTIALAGQTAAPTGWTKLTNHDNKALRVVSGTASSGGSSSFTTVFGKTATDNQTLVTANLPVHAHGVGAGSTGTSTLHLHGVPGFTTATGGSGTGVVITNAGQNSATVNTDNENNHTHPLHASTSNEGSGSPFNMPIDLRVQYVDVIRIQKD